MAFFRNKYIFSPFKQNITYESWLSNLVVCVDSLAVMKRGNHNSICKDMPKFPFPNSVNMNRHQMVKPRHPPVLPVYPNDNSSAVTLQRKRCLLQKRRPKAKQNDAIDTNDKNNNNNKNYNNNNNSNNNKIKNPDLDDSIMYNDPPTKKKCKLRKIDKSIVPKVMGSGGGGGGGGTGSSSYKFRSFVKCLKTEDKEQNKNNNNVRTLDELDQMRTRVSDNRSANDDDDEDDDDVDDRHYNTTASASATTARTATATAATANNEKPKEPNRKLHNIFKGQALYIARHKEREKELLTQVEKMKISERMRYLMKVQQKIDDQEPLIGRNPLPQRKMQSNTILCNPTLIERRVDYIVHPSRKLLIGPYCPSSDKSDNADIKQNQRNDNPKINNKVDPLPSIGDSPINRLFKGSLQLKAIRNKY